MLKAEDVRLTMGGEPTFVSIDDFESEEWNTAAVGPDQAGESGQPDPQAAPALCARAASCITARASGIPGESLPRWTFSLYWRKDGQPIWQNPDFDRRRRPLTPSPRRKTPSGCSPASRASWRLPPDMVLPAYEDPAEWIVKEGTPSRKCRSVEFEAEGSGGAQPHRPRLRTRPDGSEQAISCPFKPGTPQATQGTAGSAKKWQNPARQTIFLVPGDSPVGYRLPLGTLPLRAAIAISLYPRSPTHRSARQPLPEVFVPAGRAMPEASFQRDESGQSRVEQTLGEIGGAVRTAISVEPRDGRLCVFMPPRRSALKTISNSSQLPKTPRRELGLAVRIEGYPPPQRRAHADVIRVAPDPGVIEVNIHPASQLAGAASQPPPRSTKKRVDDAVSAADKFMIDGRHTGTGGGNHCRASAAPIRTTARSCAGPTCLKSLVLHWQRPSRRSPICSPACSSARPARRRASTRPAQRPACTSWKSPSPRCPRPEPRRRRQLPWLVDRLFRNHPDRRHRQHPPQPKSASTSCYSPDAADRPSRAFVELRGFEMPPHARMSHRCSNCWSAPWLPASGTTRTTASPSPAGAPRCTTASCCRTFVWADFDWTCIAELNEAGFEVRRPEWFAAHLEFRFPLVRRGASTMGVEALSCASALEPWHVMGEEGATGGTVRYVDSVGRTTSRCASKPAIPSR